MIFGIQPCSGCEHEQLKHFLISIELCELSEFTSCTKPLADTTASLCTMPLVWWILDSFPKEMSFSWTHDDFARQGCKTECLHSQPECTETEMFPSVVRIIVHNVHADVIAILRTSILGWLSQLSQLFYFYIVYLFIIMSITWQLHSSWFWSGPRMRPRLAVNSKDRKEFLVTNKGRKVKHSSRKRAVIQQQPRHWFCSYGKSPSAWVGEEVSSVQQEFWRSGEKVLKKDFLQLRLNWELQLPIQRK